MIPQLENSLALSQPLVALEIGSLIPSLQHARNQATQREEAEALSC